VLAAARSQCAYCRSEARRIRVVDPATGVETPLFHPLHDRWSQHFAWSDDGTKIIGLTIVGRATVESLKMNRQQMLELRRYWLSTGQHPIDQ